MGRIKTTYDLSKDLTVAKAIGKMKADNFRKWNETYYAGRVTSNCLWDLTDANLSEINTGTLRDEATVTKNLAGKREGGKTAFVTESTLEYGLCRMLEAFYDLQQVPIEVQVFRTIDDAKEWLLSEPLTHILVDKDRKILHRKVSGVLYTKRSIELIRGISMAAELYKGYDILLDLRETTTAPEMTDFMAIMSAWSRLGADFDNNIAVVIPKTEQHTRYAQIFEVSMKAQGFHIQQFFETEAAMEWLSE